MTKTKLNIRWIETGIIVVMALLVIVTLVLFIAWMVQNVNTEARCKTAGGKMGYSKCYKDGKEI